MYDQRPANFEGGFFGTRSDYNTPTSTYGTGPTNVGGKYSILTGNEGYGPSTGGYSGLGIGNPSSYGGDSSSYGGYSPTMNNNNNSYWNGSSSSSYSSSGYPSSGSWSSYSSGSAYSSNSDSESSDGGW